MDLHVWTTLRNEIAKYAAILANGGTLTDEQRSKLADIGDAKSTMLEVEG